jgi:two-component system sensor histidine kinase BaeS
VTEDDRGERGERPSDPADRTAREREVRQRMWRMRRRQRGWGPPDGGGWGSNGGEGWGPGRRGRRRGPFRRGFGCLAGLVFLLVASSIFFAVGSTLASLGPIPAIVTILVAAAILMTVGRGLRGAARSLDQIVEAQERVKVGDYAVRVGRPASPLPPIHQLAAGFDTMVERLQVDEQQRRTLLADVSHELRTPLTVITGNLEAILDGVYPADEPHLAPILEETRVLSRLIDDLRTIALSEAGTLTLHPEPTDPDVLIGEVVRSFQPVAATAGVTLATDVEGDLPILEIDPLRIREVLSNLVANALRHTPAGGTVTIGGWASAADESTPGEGSVTLTVSDTGPGIDPELLPHVFDRFVKGETSRGSGLGLAIARGLVEAHGGWIVVHSPPDGGAMFLVKLPRAE